MLFIAMAVIWGIPYLFIKIAVAEMPPATLVLARTAVAAVLLLPLAAARGALRPLVPLWRPVVAYTFLEVAAPWYLLSDAERHISSSLAGLLVAAVPLVGAALVWIFGGDDRPDRRRVAGLLFGLVGVALVVGLDVSADDAGAVLEVALVVVGYAAGPMVIARYLRDVPAIGVIAASLALTGLVYAPFGVAGMPPALSPQAIGAVVVLGLVCTALAFVVFFRLIAEVGPARATVITYLNPVVAIAAGALVLGEPVTPSMLLGFALVAAGSYVGTRRAPPAPA